MIRTKMPKDIRRYKTKIIFGLTKRQIACIALCAGLSVCFYFFYMVPNEMTFESGKWGFAVIALVSMIWIIEPENGIPMEDYLFQVLLARYWSPSKRVSSTRFLEPAKKTGTNYKKKNKSKKNKTEIEKERKYYEENPLLEPLE